jgi:hypothetical protein
MARLRYKLILTRTLQLAPPGTAKSAEAVNLFNGGLVPRDWLHHR